MYPKLLRISIESLRGELGWVVFILSAIFAFAFYYLTRLEKKKATRYCHPAKDRGDRMSSSRGGQDVHERGMSVSRESETSKTKLYKIFNALFYLSLLSIFTTIFALFTEQKTLDFNSYGLMLALAFIVGIYLLLKKAKKIGVSQQSLVDLALWGLLISMIGARLFYMLFEYQDLSGNNPPLAFFYDPLALFKISSGGLVAYGGFIVGAVFALLYIKKKDLPLGKVADIFAPSLAIGVGFARMGCNLAGCCWGAESDHFLSIQLTLFKPSLSDFSLSNYPTYNYFYNLFSSQGLNSLEIIEKIKSTTIWPAQLISSLNGVILFLVLNYIYHKYHERFKFNGILFMILMIYYSVTRFLIEMIRVDTPKEFFSLSAAQMTGIFIFTLAIILIMYNLNRVKKQSNTKEQLST